MSRVRSKGVVEFEVWAGHHCDCGGTRAEPLLSVVSGNVHHGTTADPSLDAAEVDGVLFPDAEAPFGDRDLRDKKRRCLLQAPLLRLLARFVRFDTARVICKDRLTMAGTVFRLQPYWRYLDSGPLGLQKF
jgi:hypothetical protein